MTNPYALDQIEAAPQVGSNNPFALSAIEADQQTAVRGSLASSMSANPDQAARARSLAAETGLPAAAIERNLPEVEHSTKLDAYARMIADKPVTRQFLTQPENARVAHDDVESMSLIETLANSFRRGVPGLQQGLAATALRANAGQLEQFDAVAARIDAGEKPASVRAADDPMGVAYMTPEQRNRMRASISTPLAGNIATVADTQQERQAIQQPGVVGDVLDAKTFGAAFSAFLTAPVQFIASIGPESLISSAPGLLAAIPAGIAAGPGAAAAVMGAGSFASDFGSSIVEALTKSGVDVADPTALAAATQNGPLMREVAAQAFAHASVVGSVDGASGGLASKVVLPSAVAARLATRPVARELTNAAIQVPAQGALGGVGEAGGQIAAGQDIQPGSILAEIVGEAFTAPAEIGGIAGRRVVERMQEARAAGAAAVRVEEALKVAEASKLRARDPAAFREFVDQVADGGETPTEFYIDPQTLANTLNQSGVTMQELQALAPSLAEQMTPENFVPGADLRISVAELLAAPAEITAPLVDHLRESEGAMTRAEAAQYLSEKGAAIQQEVQAELGRQDGRAAYQAEVDQVRDQFQAQLDAVGRHAPAVNTAYATMLGNFYAAQARRAGLTPQELMQRYRLGVTAQEGTGRQRLDQSAPAGRTITAANFQAMPADARGARDLNAFSDMVTSEVTAALSAGQAVTLYADGKPIPIVSVSAGMMADATGQRWGTMALATGTDASNRVQIDSPSISTAPASPASPGKPRSGPRASLSFGEDITATPSVIALLQGADLSSFLHEAGHFFLEVQADLAARIQGKILDGDTVTDGERQIVADMETVLASFGITGTPDQSALTTWLSTPLEQKREHHETFARSFERYAMEGKAPNQALQEIFQRFRAWLTQVYRTLKGLDVELDDDVRAVFDRMLATDQAIQEAQDARNMGPLFSTPEQGGMTPEEYAAYQALGQRATAEASEELDTRLLKDLKWLRTARDKALKARQKEVAALRSETMIEVRSEVMAEPVYRAWQFLTSKVSPAVSAAMKKTSARTLDPARDNLFTAISKLGGLNKAAVESQWGKQDKLEGGVFGMPLLRQEGLSIDAMAERLVEVGYLMPDEAGRADLSVFEELFADQARGVDRFSIQHDYAGEQPTESLVDPDELRGKLNTADLKNRYGDAPDAVWRTLSARRMTNSTGLDADVLAESFGFASGDQLVQALAAAQPPAEAIDALTDQRMLERHGDIGSKAELDRAADEAVHNQLRARIIATELKALEKASTRRESSDSLYGGGTVDVMAQAARNLAREAVGRVKLKDLRPKVYAAAEARSAKLAQQSIGNVAEAAMHKRNQLINNFATAAAYDAQAEIAKADAFFKKVLAQPIATVAKSRDAGTVQAARAILADFGIGAKGEPAAKYLQTLAADDPGMYAVLRDRIEALTATAKPVKEMSVDEFRALADEIQGLWHQARRAREVEIDGETLDIEKVKLELVQTLTARGVPAVAPGEGRAVTESERRLTKLQTARAALRRVEAWVQARDGAAGIGPFRQYIWQPIKEAADAYRADKAVYIRRYKELLEGLSLGKARIEAPELGYVFGYSRGGSGKAEILHAILHTGNASNLRKLLLGRGWATQNEVTGELDTGRWDAFVRRMIAEGVLGKKEFDFAQGVWDLLEGTKALAQRTHRDVFGSYFDEVTADGFTNEFGVYRGGYVPAMMDAEVVKDAATRALQEDEQQTMAYAFPSTQKGFTKSRVENNKPLLLDLRTLGSHIDKVLLFSHMERPVRDVRRVLGSRDVSELLHRVDPTAYDGLLTPWLNRAARQVVETRIPGDNGLLRTFSKMRQRAGLAAMFGNLSNAAQQITGFSLALLKVKPRHLGHGLVTYLMAPRHTARAVAEASPYMAARMDNEVQVMTDAIDEILLNPNLYEKTQQWVAKHGYFLQAAVDNVMGPIIWTGAYNQALEDGRSTTDARRLADSAVRETQGSTLPEDVSRMETGNTFVRMFTQFAGYFNMQANLLGTEFVNMMQELGMRKRAGKGLYIFTLGFLVPAMAAELIALGFKGGPEDDDQDGEIWDDWLMAVGVRAPVKGVFAMVPGLGQVMTAGLNSLNDKPYDDRISVSPAISMLESAIGVPTQVYKAIAADGEVNGRKLVRDLATLISMTTGIPATLVARPAGYALGMAQDRIEPTSAPDAVRGMLTGTPSPESKK